MRLLEACAFAAAASVGACGAFASPLYSNETLGHHGDGQRRRLAAGDSICTIEKGIDYAGNDIGNAPGATVNACCSVCAQTSGCGAFSWSAFNGGTCWLKSRKGTATANANVHSGVSTASSSGSCTIESGVDYVGNDIGNAVGLTAQACCAVCSMRSGCGAFSWTNFNGGTCWLKSARGQAIASSSVHSGVISASADTSACSSRQQNVDYAGNDIGSASGATADACCAKCSQRAGCGAFTWTDYNGGTCWLKSKRGTVVAKTGAHSGVVGSITPVTAHIATRLRNNEIPTRSVNLGGWLVGEYWMSFTSPAWTDANGRGWDGEYGAMKYFESTIGRARGIAQFEQHRQTWITENDIKEIAAAGLNTLRVPVGFWIMGDGDASKHNDVSRVYAPGSLKYLDKLINEWAVTHNLAVMLSLHAHQGSQNGYDHSAPQAIGQTTWSNSQANIDNSVQFATFLAARYKSSAAFLGMTLMNEPSFPTDYVKLWGYYKEAYRQIRATGNNCILGTSPMIQEQSPPVMMEFMRWPEYTNVWHEFHVYYKWGHEGKTEAQIMDAARTYKATHLDNWSGNYIYMGEWSLASPDEAPFRDRALLKQYAAIQLQQYTGAHAGWAFWWGRHDHETETATNGGKLSGWSLRQLLREGIFTVPAV